MVEIREQLDEIASHIFKSPKLMEAARILNIESAVHITARAYDMKITQAKEKACGLDQGIGYEMSLTKDNSFFDKR
ncbi:MAG: hypothetical protein EBT45_09110 [Alphaproteobacteria bacterium]|nr:hypothetical protein [Alphaproteobacteria bacterium]